MRNKFIDPAGNRTTYNWQVNHSDEQESGKERNIEHGANTANTGFVRQQSDPSPIIFQFEGTILHRAQVAEFNAWWALCEHQTIHFEDFTGDQFEVLITKFKPTRHRTLRNPRDFANAPRWFWRYQIELEVVRVIDSAIWEGITT